MLASALATARSTFDSSRSIIPNSSEARAAIAHAEEVAGILRRNVVQGKGNGEDTFRKLLVASHTQRMERHVVLSIMREDSPRTCMRLIKRLGKQI